MPRSIDRRGRLVPEEEYEEAKERERADRLARFSRGMGVSAPQDRRSVQMLDDEPLEYEPATTRSHDPHTLEAARMNLVAAANAWHTE